MSRVTFEGLAGEERVASSEFLQLSTSISQPLLRSGWLSGRKLHSMADAPCLRISNINTDLLFVCAFMMYDQGLLILYSPSLSSSYSSQRV